MPVKIVFPSVGLSLSFLARSCVAVVKQQADVVVESGTARVCVCVCGGAIQ